MGDYPPIADRYFRTPIDPSIPAIINHTVHEGDSLELMATVYETTPEAILTANPSLAGADAVIPRMMLTVPIRVPEVQNSYRMYVPVVAR